MSKNHGKDALANPEPYKGEVTSLSGNTITVIEAANNLDMAPLLRRYGDWAVTDFGVECLINSYPIQKERLDEQDWFTHMGEKAWVNMDDFRRAISAAKSLIDAGQI